MTYFVDRGGFPYGPYTLEQLRGYVTAGTVLPTDVARHGATGATTTVASLLEQATATAPPPGYIAPSPLYERPESVPVVPMPPNLHWAVVLLISMASGLFGVGWLIYQMVWVRNLDRSNRALVYLLTGYAAFFLLAVVGAVSMVAASGGDTLRFPVLGFSLILLAFVAMLVLHIVAVFEVRRSLLAYYNTVEPIGLRLSGVMTFFFNLYYFQHHMSRIATWKLTGYLSPQG